jgi:peroxin-4
MATHTLAAAKRLRKELQNLERSDDDDDVYLRPTNAEESILQWTALLKGPVDTPYQGGVFQLSIMCGSEYPLAPPTITFVTKVCSVKRRDT